MPKNKAPLLRKAPPYLKSGRVAFISLCGIIGTALTPEAREHRKSSGGSSRVNCCHDPSVPAGGCEQRWPHPCVLVNRQAVAALRRQCATLEAEARWMAQEAERVSPSLKPFISLQHQR